MVQLGEIARVTTRPIRKPARPVRKSAPRDYGPVPDRAQQIWKASLVEAKRRGLPRVTNRYGSGYILTGTITQIAAQVWPDMDFSRENRYGRSFLASVYPYMRACGTVVTLETNLVNGKAENHVFVNETYTDRQVIPVVPGTASTNAGRKALLAEKKVTPHEAGEDRDPMPVTVVKKKPDRSNPNPSSKVCRTCSRTFKSAKSRATHEQIHSAGWVPPRDRIVAGSAGREVRSQFIVTGDAAEHKILDDGRFQCLEDGCGKIFDHAAGIVGHKKHHYNIRRDKMIRDLQDEVIDLRRNGGVRQEVKIVEQVISVTPTNLRDALHIVQQAADESIALRAEADQLRSRVAELEKTAAATDESTVLDMVRETLDKVTKGDVLPLRALADLNEALSLRQ